MMNGLIGDFTKHLAEAVKIGKNASFNSNNKQISSVLVCGLGGSGIGGTIISQMTKNGLSHFLQNFV